MAQGRQVAPDMARYAAGGVGSALTAIGALTLVGLLSATGVIGKVIVA